MTKPKKRMYRLERLVNGGTWKYCCSCEWPGNAYYKAVRLASDWDTEVRIVLFGKTISRVRP